ncbi:multisubunit potassium/proton antiporter, PhaF subunit [Pontibaca methylaminivorans]|uniref:Multisubunit potassium/proton antiporter, PhaF subunit n=1 Tax=Pontibaca methylaminivorans TaxID=515897 RepID=A0A1R3WXY0_9RHOB|nr:K+/H+ antiporter subunit F [Pontibaca methylaminivorans]SIT82583.1 multisubunit potassium/proton antiporter, PhaF subunit [Pontibaca methylaminivorans]
MILTLAIWFNLLCFGAALLITLFRVLTAPGLSDRILALDTMVINVIALLLLYGMLVGSAIYFESALIFAMLGFVSTVAYARYVLRGNIIE